MSRSLYHALLAALTAIAIAAAYFAGGFIPPAHAKSHRDPEVPKRFQHLHPCPSTGRTTGACPGYVRDHIIALCKGGPDTVDNMQWQTVAEGKAKDKWECR